MNQMALFFRKQKGFSLIEVLVAVLLLAALIALMAQLSYGNVRKLKKARRLEKTVRLLERKMLLLEEEFKGKNVFKLPAEDEGDFDNEENWFWSYQTQPLELPSSRILLAVAQIPENDLNTQMAETLIGVLSETVVELKLTVRHDPGKGKGKGGKSWERSLVSYFVNYEDAPDLILKRISSLVPAGGAAQE